MRATMFGRQIVTDSNDKLVGVNIGYNFHAEHEYGTSELVENINNTKYDDMMQIMSCKSLIDKYKLKKSIEKRQKINKQVLKRWENTPFKGYVLLPNVKYFTHKIIINNDSIRNTYNVFLTDNSNYTMLYIGNGITNEQWHNKFGSKRTLTEEDLFYMDDYQEIPLNMGYIMAGRPRVGEMQQQKSLVAQWANTDNGLMILMKDDRYIQDIISALRNGNLALVPKEPRLFKHRGCCLIDLESAYKPRVN